MPPRMPAKVIAPTQLYEVVNPNVKPDAGGRFCGVNIERRAGSDSMFVRMTDKQARWPLEHGDIRLAS